MSDTRFNSASDVTISNALSILVEELACGCSGTAAAFFDPGA